VKNTLCLFVSIGFLSLIGCGDLPQKNPSQPAKELLTGTSDDVAPEREEQSVYPKPMVPVMPVDNTFAWSNDQRFNYPGTFAITAPPTNTVRTPGEWENKQALLLAWTGNFADVVAGIIRSAKVTTDVTVAYDSNQSLNDFKYQMQSRGVSINGVTTIQLPVQTLWMRDYGPMTVEQNGKMGFVDVRYYPGRLYDDAFPALLAQKWDINNFRMPVDFEGGNFVSDGAGTCYASTVLLSATAEMSGASEGQVRTYFKRYLGCEQLVILQPLYGEGTGHIDMFAKLANKNTMVLGQYRKSQSDSRRGTIDAVNADILDNNAAVLNNVTLMDGSSLNVVRMPMPANSDNNFRTYVNSQFINGVNLIPVYSNDDRFQDEALAIWQQVMPNWQHVDIDATELITWAGAIHCILMEVGEGTRAKFQSTPETICNDFDCAPNMTSSTAPSQPSQPDPEPEPEPEDNSNNNNSSTTTSCPSGETADCNGNCAPTNWLADGYCDDGAYSHNGTAINFSCEEFSYDRGDCQPAGQSCASNEMLDCRNQCAPKAWLGDGYCDAGNYVYEATGQAIYLNCSAFQNDGGDC
jgi:agmatine deiminase